MTDKHIIAVPTAFNIYRVSDETLQATQGLMAQFPAAIVMETLVMKGLAKVVARINTFDVEEEEDTDIEVPEMYEMGAEEETPTPDNNNPGEEELPGPWYPMKEEEDE